MAKVFNNERFPITLPTGHIVPGATGTWEGFEFVVTSPGVLETTNDVLRGDNATRVKMMVAAGSAVEYDDDPEPTVVAFFDEQALRDTQAAAEIAQGEKAAKSRELMYAEYAVKKAAEEAKAAAEAKAAEEAKALEEARAAQEAADLEALGASTPEPSDAVPAASFSDVSTPVEEPATDPAAENPIAPVVKRK